MAGWPLRSLCQMAAVRARSRCEDADGDAAGGASAVAFEIELSFEGVVDRFDDLTERLEEAAAGSGAFVFVCGAQQRGAVIVEERFELGAGVSLVGDHDLTGSGREQRRFGFEQLAGDFVFVDLRIRDDERDGKTAGAHTRCRRSPQKNREWLAQYP